MEALDGRGGAGETIIEVLELDDPRLTDWRRRKIASITSHAAEDPSLLIGEMCFPRDLPDLTVDPPPHNTKPEGVQQSWFAKRARGVLPETY